MTKSIKLWLGMGLATAMAACAGPEGDVPGDNAEAGDGAETVTVLAGVPAVEAARMKDFVANRIDRAAVRVTLRTAAGRHVDCVDIAEQPALKNPALRGRKIEKPPQVIDAPADVDAFDDSQIQPEPMFERDGRTQATCPTGTVPIAEVTLADVGRFKSMDAYFSKTPAGMAPSVPAVAPEGLATPHVGPTSQHQYAHAYRNVTNWGAETYINIASFATELNSEFSLGQIWVVGGSGAGLQTLEAGLQRYHQLYGDNDPHLFIYSTRGNYADGTGCYNNSCNDFVQVSDKWFPGMSIGPVTTVGGTQHSLYVHWTKAGDTGAWWLSVKGELVGYYPRALYTAVANHAAKIDFGGEIIDGQTDGRHTKTNMGSGQFAAAGWLQAAYMRRIRFHDSNPSGNAVTWTEATGLTEHQSDAACYSIDLHNSSDDDWHNYFFYGGPGYSNPGCL
jgi:hypothetical protein